MCLLVLKMLVHGKWMVSVAVFFVLFLFFVLFTCDRIFFFCVCVDLTCANFVHDMYKSILGMLWISLCDDFFSFLFFFLIYSGNLLTCYLVCGSKPGLVLITVRTISSISLMEISII